MLDNVAVLIASFACSLLATRKLIVVLRKRGIMDVPNGRSSHTIPTPRGGGLGIIVGLLAGLVVARLMGIELVRPELLLALAIIALTGLIDDRLGLPVLVRFGLQLLAAAIVIFRSGGLTHLPLPEPFDISLSYIGIPLSLLWIVASTNLFNFLDGIDGFAGLQGAVAGLGIAFLGFGDVFTGVGLAITGSCIGFLIYNWHPAKVFMGDVGSGTLGFLLAALPFELAPPQRNTAVFFIAMCLWFFLSDGVFTIFRRLLHGEKIWVAHRSHLYQRLVKTGLRHDQVTLRVIGAASVLALLAVVSTRWDVMIIQWLVVALALVAFLKYYHWTLVREELSAVTSES